MGTQLRAAEAGEMPAGAGAPPAQLHAAVAILGRHQPRAVKPSQATLFNLYGEFLIKCTGVHESDVTGRG